MLGTLLAGRYKIIKPLGEGGFGEAYLAEDQHLPDAQCCVVKKLKTEHHQDATLKVARRLFDAEAMMLHKLGHHDQIPRLLAHFEEAEGFYLVEEFIAGHGIDQELEPEQPLREEDAIALLRDILEVLDFVHQNQVIHRDIKPSNLIRRQTDGKVVLIDFGAVKQMTTQLINNHSHTPQTVLIGSPGYVPSEQFRGNPKLSSDVYAVGMIGIQALTGFNPGMGQLPEDDETGELVWRNHAKVSSEFATILEKMVLYDYRQRYGSASTALAAVQALIQERSSAPQAEIIAIDDFATTEIGPEESVPATLVTAPPQEQTAPDNVEPAPTLIPPTPGSVAASSVMEPPPLPETAAQASETQYQLQENFQNHTPAVTAATVAATPPPLPNSARAAKGSKKWKAAALGLVVLLLGGSAIGVASPHVEPLCQVFNNCSRNLRFQTVYKDAIAAAEAAQSDSQQAKNLKDLEAAHQQFEDAIASLKSIPEDVKVYPTVKQELPEYEKQFKAVQARLATEKKAQEAFEQAEATAKAAEAKTAEAEKAATVAPISEVQKQWKAAQTQLESIPEDSFVAAQAKEKQQSNENEIQALQDKIDQLIAAEKERQRQAAIAAAAARKKQQAAAAQRAATRSTTSSSSTSRSSTPSRSTSSTPSRSTSAPARSTAPAPKPAPKKEPLWGAPAEKEPLW